MATPHGLRAIVCEGPDDLAAIRQLLLEEGYVASRPVARTEPSPGAGPQQFERADGEMVAVQHRDGKTGLAKLALLHAEGAAKNRPVAILVSFDPDLDPPDREFGFFEREFTKLARDKRIPPLGRGSEGELEMSMADGRRVVVLPAPWRSSRPVFAGLNDEHCLERVLIDGIVQSPLDARVLDWASSSTAELSKLVSKHGYKRAFRIWNAALHPESESFVAKLLQGPHKSACLAALRATPASQALTDMLKG